MDNRVIRLKNLVIVELHDDGIYPNNSEYPVLLYRQVLHLPFFRPAAAVRRLFGNNGWTNSWKDGIYSYNHYHSNTHEVLGVIRGYTDVLLGGENGVVLRIRDGDVLVIPAGVAHKNLHPANKLVCIGAYPGGIKYDLNFGVGGERPFTDMRIANLEKPEFDPVYGDRGPLQQYWNKRRQQAIHRRVRGL